MEALAETIALLMGSAIGAWLLMSAFVLAGSERNGQDAFSATLLAASLAVVALWIWDASGALGLAALTAAVLLGAASAGFLLMS